MDGVCEIKRAIFDGAEVRASRDLPKDIAADPQSTLLFIAAYRSGFMSGVETFYKGVALADEEAAIEKALAARRQCGRKP